MNNVDPKNKNVSEYDNSYDADDKVTNGDNPVREGTEDASILSDQAPTGSAEYVKLNEYDNHPREQEEFVDDDALNIKNPQPED